MTAVLTEQQWAEARAAAMAAIPGEVQTAGLPSVLLPYQAEAVRLLDSVGVEALFIEKSRRIGLTWGLGAYAVLRAARQKAHGGMDVMYISYSREMTREFVDVCAMWARAFDSAASAVEETVFDQGDDGKAINAFRIKFASGFEIMALSSSPRGLRGKQGVVIIDEAAFVDLGALLKSAMAFLMWGGQVVVCSTHLGVDNVFNSEIQEILAGRSPYAHMRIDLDQALKQGLYRRIALVTGKTWTPEGEAAWRQKILDFYRDNADEELYCIPSASSGSWLPGPLIEARMTVKQEVLRLDLPADYIHLPPMRQEALLDDFLTKLRAQLQALDLDGARYAFGSDFGRVRDLTTGSLLALESDLKRREVLSYELRRVPGAEQKRICQLVLGHVRPRLIGAAFDATGMGWTVAEDMGRLFGLRENPEDGAGLVMAVKFTEEWYRVNMPPLKGLFEDDHIALIADADHLADLRQVKVVRGIARVPPERTEASEGGGKKRHGDYAIGLALADFATRMKWWEAGYRPAPRQDGGQPAGPTGMFDTEASGWWKGPLGSRLRGSV